jgi:hypothetical protein
MFFKLFDKAFKVKKYNLLIIFTHVFFNKSVIEQKKS